MVRISLSEQDNSSQISGRIGEEGKFFEALSHRPSGDAHQQSQKHKALKHFFNLRFDIGNATYAGEIREVQPNDPTNSQFEDPNFNSILNTEDGHENTQLVISTQRHEDSRLLRRLEESLLSDERAKLHSEIKEVGKILNKLTFLRLCIFFE